MAGRWQKGSFERFQRRFFVSPASSSAEPSYLFFILVPERRAFT